MSALFSASCPCLVRTVRRVDLVAVRLHVVGVQERLGRHGDRRLQLEPLAVERLVALLGELRVGDQVLLVEVRVPHPQPDAVLVGVAGLHVAIDEPQQEVIDLVRRPRSGGRSVPFRDDCGIPPPASGPGPGGMPGPGRPGGMPEPGPSRRSTGPYCFGSYPNPPAGCRPSSACRGRSSSCCPASCLASSDCDSSFWFAFFSFSMLSSDVLELDLRVLDVQILRQLRQRHRRASSPASGSTGCTPRRSGRRSSCVSIMSMYFSSNL